MKRVIRGVRNVLAGTVMLLCVMVAPVDAADTSEKDYYESQLNAGASFIYNLLENNIAVTYDGKTAIQTEVPPGLLNINEVGTDYQCAVDAFRADHPEVFWIAFEKLSINYKYSPINGSVNKITLQSYNNVSDYYVGKDTTVVMNGSLLQNFGGNVPFTDAESVISAIANVENRVNECLETIADCETDYEKVKGIHDWLAKQITYDYNHYDQSLYAALIYKHGVCAGYVSSFDYIANKAGIETIYVSGVAHSTSNQNENHAWNLVKLDGKWYALDITWDDAKNGIDIYDDFFLVGLDSPSEILDNRTFEQTHEMHNYFSEGNTFILPEISRTAYGVVESGSSNSNQNNDATSKKGDVNSDGKVELKDAQMTLKAALSIIKLDSSQAVAAEVTGDGKVDLADAQKILKAALSIIKL